MTIWNCQWETASRDTLRAHQQAALQETVAYVYERLPYYREKMKAKGLLPSNIKGLDDLHLLPFTTKDDFMSNYPFGMLAVPLREVVRIHGSSGTTTGKPTIVGYTQKDLDTWAELCARFASAGGVGPDDIAQICFGYGLFTGGLGLHYGLEKIGAMILPTSSGNTERQIKFIQDFGTTTIVSTPSYALYIAEKAREKGIALNKYQLRWGLFGAEPWSEGMRRQIDQQLGITATDNYGLSEVIGPGVSGECLERNGLHIFEDYFIVETIDPQTGQPVPEGEIGELVFTTLGKEATPLIRYRTRDLAFLDSSPCPCGRTLLKMSRVRGRTDDMLIIRGVNIFPSQVEQVLLDIEHTQPHYQMLVFRDGGMDILEIQVEVTEEIFYDEMRRLKDIEEEIRTRIRGELGIDPRIKLVEPKSLERFMGKARRVQDTRPQD